MTGHSLLSVVRCFRRHENGVLVKLATVLLMCLLLCAVCVFVERDRFNGVGRKSDDRSSEKLIQLKRNNKVDTATVDSAYVVLPFTDPQRLAVDQEGSGDYAEAIGDQNTVLASIANLDYFAKTAEVDEQTEPPLENEPDSRENLEIYDPDLLPNIDTNNIDKMLEGEPWQQLPEASEVKINQDFEFTHPPTKSEEALPASANGSNEEMILTIQEESRDSLLSEQNMENDYFLSSELPNKPSADLADDVSEKLIITNQDHDDFIRVKEQRNDANEEEQMRRVIDGFFGKMTNMLSPMMRPQKLGFNLYPAIQPLPHFAEAPAHTDPLKLEPSNHKPILSQKTKAVAPQVLSRGPHYPIHPRPLQVNHWLNALHRHYNHLRNPIESLIKSAGLH